MCTSNRHCRTGISHEQSLLMRPPSQRHRTIGQHLRISFPHLQFPLQFFSQFQLNSNEHTLLTSSRTVHLEIHTFVSSLRIWVCSARFRLHVYRRALPDALLAWRVVEELIGSFCLLCSCRMRIVVFQALFTLKLPQLLVCVMTVQRSSRSMLMESRVMSSGSCATSGIVSVNS